MVVEEARQSRLGETEGLPDLIRQIAEARKSIPLVGRRVWPDNISKARGQLPPGTKDDTQETETETCVSFLAVSPAGTVYAASPPLDESVPHIQLRNYPLYESDDLAFTDDSSEDETGSQLTQADELVEAVSRANGGFLPISTDECRALCEPGANKKPGLVRLLEMWGVEEREAQLQEAHVIQVTSPCLAVSDKESHVSDQLSKRSDLPPAVSLQENGVSPNESAGVSVSDSRVSAPSETAKNRPANRASVALTPAGVSLKPSSVSLVPSGVSLRRPCVSSKKIPQTKSGKAKPADVSSNSDNVSKRASALSRGLSASTPKRNNVAKNSYAVLQKDGSATRKTAARVSPVSASPVSASPAIMPTEASIENAILKTICDDAQRQKNEKRSISLTRRKAD